MSLVTIFGNFFDGSGAKSADCGLAVGVGDGTGVGAVLAGFGVGFGFGVGVGVGGGGGVGVGSGRPAAAWPRPELGDRVTVVTQSSVIKSGSVAVTA
jgi:hypothetical protein